MVSRRTLAFWAATCGSITLLLVGGASAQDKPTNPTIKPGTDGTKLEEGLKANVKMSIGKFVPWPAGWIPEACKAFATERGLNPNHFEVRNVFYDECQDPWVFCRHKDMGMTNEDLILLVSRVPLRTRAYVRHIIGTPELGGGLAGLWYSNGDIVLVNKPSLRTTLHEASHALDWEVPRSLGRKESISATTAWRSALASDPSVASDYSRNGYPDNFAETGVMGFYDAYVPGGFAALQPASGQIKNQLSLFRSSMGNKILQGAKCNDPQEKISRIPSSKAVPKASGASARLRERSGSRPDTRFVDPHVGTYTPADDGTVFAAPLGPPPNTDLHEGVGVLETDPDGKTKFQCGHDHEHY